MKTLHLEMAKNENTLMNLVPICTRNTRIPIHHLRKFVYYKRKPQEGSVQCRRVHEKRGKLFEKKIANLRQRYNVLKKNTVGSMKKF